jgi:hypothetical protein
LVGPRHVSANAMFASLFCDGYHIPGGKSA